MPVREVKRVSTKGRDFLTLRAGIFYWELAMLPPHLASLSLSTVGTSRNAWFVMRLPESAKESIRATARRLGITMTEYLLALHAQAVREVSVHAN